MSAVYGSTSNECWVAWCKECRWESPYARDEETACEEALAHNRSHHPDTLTDVVSATESDTPMTTPGQDRFCCLGVLCELAVKDGVIEPAYVRGDGAHSYDGDEAELPQGVMDWAGLTEASPNVANCDLAQLNDRGVRFPRIAELIEEHL